MISNTMICLTIKGEQDGIDVQDVLMKEVIKMD